MLCLFVGCGNRSGRDKGLYFAKVPSIIENQGKEARDLSEERRSRWILAISRDDLTDTILENDQCTRLKLSANSLPIRRLPIRLVEVVCQFDLSEKCSHFS